jgi:uncharacterized protein YjiS (DUF1127 family)
MNLVNTFARIKKLFIRREGKTLHLTELSDHMRRDLGLDNGSIPEHKHKEDLPKKEVIIHGHLTRAP